MTAQALLLAALGGVLIGFLLTLFGGGGSVLAVPWLVYFVGIADTHIAIASSATAVAANALVSLWGQARTGQVKWPCAIVFGVSGLAGSLAGAHLALRTDGHVLLFWFGIAMVAIALSMLIPRKSEGKADVHLDRRLTPRLAGAGMLAGLAAGFFGIGGGFLIVPGLVAATGMTLANAAASSLVSVALFGGATSVSYAAAGQIDWPLTFALIIGGAVGTMIGLPVSKRLAGNAALARTLFAVMVAGVGLYIIFAKAG